MDGPRYSPKQRLARAVWIGASLAAILFALPPYHERTVVDDRGMLVYPDPRVALCFFGIMGTASGTAALFARKRPLILFGLAALAMSAGACVGTCVAHAIYPGAYLRGESEELTVQRRHAGEIVDAGVLFGAISVPCVAAVSAALRKRSDPATSS
jgi:hypothetical protein